jgi:glycine/D-amino acid oxidase-like deaminating enzyme
MQTADICVIGGGLLGTATAYFGACAGLKVILLEEKDLAAGASGAAFGGVSVGIYSYSSARVPETYVAISKASLELYRRLQDELGPPLDFYSPGSLDPFYSEEGLARGRERAAGLRACGVPCELLDGAQIRAIEPAVSDVVRGAIYCPIDGHVTPFCVVWAFAKAARQLGADIRTGVRVHSIIRAGDRAVGVVTDQGPVSADWIVNTAGLGVAALAKDVGIDIPVDYSRGQMFVSEPVAPLLRTYIHNIKQTPVGTIVIGATRESGTLATSTTISGTKEILSWACRLIPALADLRLLRSWAGIRPVPPDGYPIIGPVDGLEHMLVAVMHRGVTLAPIVGRVLIDLITLGRTDHDITPYRLSRFDRANEPGEARETFYAG